MLRIEKLTLRGTEDHRGYREYVDVKLCVFSPDGSGQVVKLCVT